MAIFFLKAIIVLWMVETAACIFNGLVTGSSATKDAFVVHTHYGWAMVISHAILDLSALASAMFLAYHNL